MAYVYYNEFDPDAAAILREAITEGIVAPGDVDERSISDVTPGDLAGYDQHHFFAGIGGWSIALRLAGWPDSEPVWTGSCPCQPFSQAGQGKGFDDERHLWPVFFHLITLCRPSAIFGEQVASPDGLTWLDLVSTDLEGSGYTVGAADLCSAGLGAPNIRQRLWWVGYTRDTGLSDAEPQDFCGAGWGQERRATTEPSGPLYPWREFEWLDCRDGKRRPTKPGLFPLAARLAGDVAMLRAAGNAINPWVAKTFIESAEEARHELIGSGLLDFL